MPLTPDQMRSLAHGFLDRANRELLTPGGRLEPRANAVSALVERWQQSGVLALEGQPPQIRVVDRPAAVEFVNELRAVLEKSARTPAGPLALFTENRESDWHRILENTQALFDPATSELTALSDGDLRDAQARLQKLEQALTVEDRNARYVRGRLSRLHARPDRDISDRWYLARLEDRAQVEAVLRAGAFVPAAARQNLATHVTQYGEDAAQALVPGETMEHVQQVIATVDRATFDELRNRFSVFARETARERDKAATRAANARAGGVQKHLESFESPRPASKNRSFVERLNSEEREGTRADRALDRLFEKDPYLAQEIAEQRTIRRAFARREETDEARYAQERTFDIIARQGKFVGTVEYVGRQQFVLVDKERNYLIVPYRAVNAQCVGVKAMRTETWKDGPPALKIFRGWDTLGIPVTITRADIGLGIKAEHPVTVADQRKNDQTRDEFTRSVVDAEKEYRATLARDFIRTRQLAEDYSRNLYALISSPPTIPLEQRIASRTLEDGQGRRETVPHVYEGPVVATGMYYAFQYVDGALVPHETLTIGNRQVGEVLAIGYEEKFETARVEQMGHDRDVAELAQRFASRLSEEQVGRFVEQQTPLATQKALERTGVEREIVWLDPFRATERLHIDGQIVHATAHALYIADSNEPKMGVVLRDHLPNSDFPYEEGQHLGVSVSSFGLHLTELPSLDSEQLQELSGEQRLQCRRDAHDHIAAQLIATRLGVDAGAIQHFKPDLHAVVNTPHTLHPVLVTNEALYLEVKAATINEPTIYRMPLWEKTTGRYDPLVWELQQHGGGQFGYDGHRAVALPHMSLQPSAIPVTTIAELQPMRTLEGFGPFALTGEIGAVTPSFIAIASSLPDVDRHDFVVLSREDMQIAEGLDLEVGHAVNLRATGDHIAIESQRDPNEREETLTVERERSSISMAR